MDLINLTILKQGDFAKASLCLQGAAANIESKEPISGVYSSIFAIETNVSSLSGTKICS
jgi:hypothetical protein